MTHDTTLCFLFFLVFFYIKLSDYSGQYDLLTICSWDKRGGKSVVLPCHRSLSLILFLVIGNNNAVAEQYNNFIEEEMLRQTKAVFQTILSKLPDV